MSSDASANASHIGYDPQTIYHNHLPETLNKLDVDDPPVVMSTDSVHLLMEQLNNLLKQIPDFNPPNNIPKQTFIRKEDIDPLVRKTDAATNTTSPPPPPQPQPQQQPKPVLLQPPQNGKCYYLIPSGD